MVGGVSLTCFEWSRASHWRRARGQQTQALFLNGKRAQTGEENKRSQQTRTHTTLGATDSRTHARTRGGAGTSSYVPLVFLVKPGGHARHQRARNHRERLAHSSTGSFLAHQPSCARSPWERCPHPCRPGDSSGSSRSRLRPEAFSLTVSLPSRTSKKKKKWDFKNIDLKAEYGAAAAALQAGTQEHGRVSAAAQARTGTSRWSAALETRLWGFVDNDLFFLLSVFLIFGTCLPSSPSDSNSAWL